MPNGPRCTACELCQTSAVLNNLQGEGPVPCKVMFVGQAPAQAEESLLRPLVGETGHLFGDLLAEAGLSRSQVRIENAVRCMALPGKDPTAKYIQACRPHLVGEILRCQPEVIVVMGAVALQSVLGFAGITNLRGRFFKIDRIGDQQLGREVAVYCMYMPAKLFRRWEDYPVVMEDFRKLGRKLSEGWAEEKLGEYRVAQSVEDVTDYFEYLNEQPRVVFDLETTSFDFWDFNLRPDCNILCASFSAYPGTGFVVPLMQQHAKPYWSKDDLCKVRGILNGFFISGIPKWCQNGPFDINFLRANGFDFNLNSFAFDTMLAHSITQENLPHSLDALCEAYTSMPLYSHKLKEWQDENGKITTYADFLNELLWVYSGADADATVRTGDSLKAQLETEMTEVKRDGVPVSIPLISFFNEIVMPLSRALIDMEFRGVVLDVDYVRKLHGKEMEAEALLTAGCYKLAGREFNLRSPKQLTAVMFNPPTPPQNPNWDGLGVNGKPYVPGFGLPILKKTEKDAPSTDEETLKELQKRTRHPITDLVLGLRKCQKKISTYLAGRDGSSGILKYLVESTGRVHADWKQHTVVTGRLATADPALHNIPNPDKDPDYALVRLVFTVPDGWWMLQCDYSQLELRIVAEISQEKVMLEAFARGEDIHRLVASEVNEVPMVQVTSEMRHRAKFVNFGLIYGRSAFSLAEEYGISVREAQDYIDKYFKRFPRLEAYFDWQKGVLRNRGVITNGLGRKRRLYGYQFLEEARARRYGRSDFFLRQCRNRRQEMERQAINFGVQSTGSDILSRATGLAHQEYKRRDMKSGLIISHHDALYAETPSEEIYVAASILVEVMEAPVPELGGVSFPVDLKVGKRWGETDGTATKMVNDYVRKQK